MKAKSENYNTKYEPEVIKGTDISITFSESHQNDVTNINASVKIGENDCGHLGYSSKDNYIICQLKPLDDTIKANVGKIFSKFGECLSELISK